MPFSSDKSRKKYYATNAWHNSEKLKKDIMNEDKCNSCHHNPKKKHSDYCIKCSYNNKHSSERKQFINDFNNMEDDKKLKLLKDVSMNKDERDDFMKSEKTADELALNYLDGREVLADLAEKLGYDYSV